MNITLPKAGVIHLKVAGEHTTVKVEYLVIEDSHLTIRAFSREDALTVCYYYRHSFKSEIERAADGGWLVVVRKEA